MWQVAPPGTEPPPSWPSVDFEPDWASTRGPAGFTDAGSYAPRARLRSEHMQGELDRIRERREALEAELASRQHWELDDPALQAEHDGVAALVRALDAFAGVAEAPGLVADVERRLETATTIRARTVDAYDDAWRRVVREIAETGIYGGLELAPQVGLVPLGPDPASSLQEFARIDTGTVPTRDDDGALVLDGESAVVLVLVPGGRFHMGAVRRAEGAPGDSVNIDPLAEQSEGPVHEVELDPFFLSKYEVTQTQWLGLSGTKPSSWPVGRSAQGKTVTGRNPVETVSWFDARAHLDRVGLVLPTEAQWEYAARATTRTPWWFGSDPASIQGKANIADASAVRNRETWAEKAFEALDDGHVAHAPVGTFAPNPWGFCEMLGNVREWCLDRFSTYDAPARAGDGLRMEFYDPDLIVTRGSSYSGRLATSRSAFRGRTKAQLAETWVGIRPARRVEP